MVTSKLQCDQQVGNLCSQGGSSLRGQTAELPSLYCREHDFQSSLSLGSIPGTHSLLSPYDLHPAPGPLSPPVLRQVRYFAHVLPVFPSRIYTWRPDLTRTAGFILDCGTVRGVLV